MGRVLTIKYSNPSSLVVDFHINNIIIPNMLMDLGVSINVMDCETMEGLGLSGLRWTPTILQLSNHSTQKPEGILEDVVIFIYSCKYPNIL